MIPGITSAQQRLPIPLTHVAVGFSEGISDATRGDGNLLFPFGPGFGVGLGGALAVSTATAAAAGSSVGVGVGRAEPPLTPGAGHAAGTSTAIAVSHIWETAWSASLTVNSAGWNGSNLRQLFSTSILLVSGTKIRLTLRASSAGEAAQVSQMWMGPAATSGDPYDFDGTQVQVTVGGATTFTAPINTAYVTDEITCVLDKTRPFVIATYFNNAAADIISQTFSSGVTSYTKSGTDEASAADATGTYTTTVNTARFIAKIEVSGTQPGIGAALGTGTGTAVGMSLSRSGAGAASGVGAASAVGNSVSETGTGATAGVGAGSAVSASTVAAAGTVAAGIGDAAGLAPNTQTGAGAAAGVGAATGVGRGWQNTFTATLNVDSTGWSGFNMRQVLNASLLSTSGSHVRITLQGAAAGTENGAITSMWIGHAAASGDAYDYDGTQVQVTVGGSNSFSIPLTGTVVTDEITYSLDETKNLVIAMFFNDASNDVVRGSNSVTGATNYFRSVANETGTTNVSGYTATGSAVRAVNKIEVSP